MDHGHAHFIRKKEQNHREKDTKREKRKREVSAVFLLPYFVGFCFFVGTDRLLVFFFFWFHFWFFRR